MFFFVFGLIVFLVVLALFLVSVTKYNPTAVESIKIQNASGNTFIDKKTLDIMIWNIGYAGLGKEMDFFYEGGKNVRPSQKMNTKYLQEIGAFVRQNDSLDFILLQEVDINSKRSYHKNQLELLGHNLPNHNRVFAKNYNVLYVPVPFSNPMGSVVSGLVSFSRYDPEISKRFGFQGNYSWPKRLFMPDRCFVMQRFQIENGKELILIHTHNSAFDGGQLRNDQMKLLKDVAITEYKMGNYVVICGDWNLNPPGFDPSEIKNGDLGSNNDIGRIAVDQMPAGWQWVYDPGVPSNRNVNMLYKMGVSNTTIIDFYLISPNINSIEINTIDLNFEASDHNPVIFSFEIL